MSLNFQLDGVYEHRVQTDVVFNLRVTKDGQPTDSKIPVEAWLKGISENIRGDVTFNNSNYRIVFFPGVVGKFELHIKVNNQWLYKDDDAIVNIVDRLSTHYVDVVFEVSGPGIHGGMVGKETHIIIHTKDSTTNLVDPDTISELEVRVGSGNLLQKIKPERVDKGYFKASYQVDTPGFYIIDVFYQGKSVLKEQPRAHFTSPACASNTKAVNLPKGFVTVGKPAQFVIQARNKNDLNATTGGDEFKVSCDGPSQIDDLVMHDTCDGKYTVSFTLPESGVYEFHISLNGSPIGNSPVKISGTRK